MKRLNSVDTRRHLRGDLRFRGGDRGGLGRKLGIWGLALALLGILAVVNLWHQSKPAAVEDVPLDGLKAAFAQVVPGETAAPDLARLGFNTAHGGVRRLTYLGLMEYFAPRDSAGFDRLDPAAQKCLNNPDGCSAYVFRLARAQGSENQAAFGFVNAAKANPGTVVDVVFLIHDGRVAYKAMSGV
jgi:hypothetical protein